MSPLANRAIAVTKHMEPWLANNRVKSIFQAAGEVFLVSDFDYTDAELLAQCQERGVDTFIAYEYVGHRGSRRRLFRQAGINYWHMGLAVVNHYKANRFDWALYEDDTYLRHVTSPDKLDCEAARYTGKPIKRVLVIGQVSGDQALRFGGNGYDSCKLIEQTRTILPNATIKYRPHPKTVLRKLETTDGIWYPDPYLEIRKLQKKPVRAGVTKKSTRDKFGVIVDVSSKPLADEIAWADAVVTINSTAVFESIIDGVPVYHAGIPSIHEHPSGIFYLGHLDDGACLVPGEYKRAMHEAVSNIQQDGARYTPQAFAEHEKEMLIARNDTAQSAQAKPSISVPMNTRGTRLGGLKQFADTWKPKSKVLIVGSGPSALGIDRVNIDEYTIIAINAACGIVDPDLLMIFNADAWRFPCIWQRLKGRQHLIGEGLLEQAGGYPFDHYEFGYRALANRGTFTPWSLSAEAGIAGAAIQVAASDPNVSQIDMIGLDFSNWDNHFYDYRKAPIKPPCKPFGARLKYINHLIEALKHRITFKHYGQSAIVKTNPAVRQL